MKDVNKTNHMEKIKYVVIFIAGILLGIVIKYEYDTVKVKKVSVQKDYVFLGNETTNDTIDVGKSIDGYSDSLVVDPFGIYNNPKGLVPDAKTAVIIATATLNPIWGEQELNNKKPFEVVLLNGKIWSVNSTGPHHKEWTHTSTTHILIRKSDGKVLKIWGEK